MELKINSPSISEETMQKMAEFFLKNTVPLILAEEKERRNQINESISN